MGVVVKMVMGEMVLMGETDLIGEMSLVGEMVVIVMIIVMGECGDGGHDANGQDREMVVMKVIVMTGRWW